MLQPITVTEASRHARSPNPRKLQKARSQRRRLKTSPSSVASSSARKDKVQTYSPERPNSTVRSSSSTDSSFKSSHPLAPHSLRVHTKGALLTSGFAYHPGLFDLKIHPIMWDKFTNQIVDTARLSAAERAKVWAIGTAAAVTTSSHDSHQIGRDKSQRIQVEKVREGLEDESEDSLGDLLRQWNEGYFAERGLLARLDVSAATPASQHDKILHREPRSSMHIHDRQLARAERKFSIVITQISEPGELPDNTQEPRASGSTKRSPQHESANEERPPDLSGFKPLPELPLNAHPLLDVMADLSNVERSDELFAANQVAELEGEENQVTLDGDALVAELPAVELQERTVKEYRDLVGSPEPDEVEQQPELEARSAFEPHSMASKQPPSSQQPQSNVADEEQSQPQVQLADIEQQLTENWPLLQELTSNGTLHQDQQNYGMTSVVEQSSTDGAVSSESVMAQTSQYKLFPRHSSEHLFTGHSTTPVEPGDEHHHKPATLLAFAEETVVKPMASPSASFFLPLDIKPVSTTLDIDPQLAVKDMATAH